MHTCIIMAWTQQIRTFVSQTAECLQQKHTQHAPSTKTECDNPCGWTKEIVTNVKTSPKLWRDTAGNAEEEASHTHTTHKTHTGTVG